MRAEKRKKNAPKELARLKQALSMDKKGDAVMADIQDIVTVVPADKIKKQTDVGEMEGEGEWEIVNNIVHRFVSCIATCLFIIFLIF